MIGASSSRRDVEGFLRRLAELCEDFCAAVAVVGMLLLSVNAGRSGADRSEPVRSSDPRSARVPGRTRLGFRCDPQELASARCGVDDESRHPVYAMTGRQPQSAATMSSVYPSGAKSIDP